MLLLLLDPLTAIAYGAIMVLLVKLFFLVLVPLSLLLALWWHRLGKQFDREPSEPRVVPPITDAGSGQWYLVALGLAMGFAVVVLAVMVAQWS